MSVMHAQEVAGQSAPHQVYRWRGEPYEIGFQHGRALRAEILEEVGPAIEQFAADRDMTVQGAASFARSEWGPLFAQHTPAVMEEVKGLAAGSGIDGDLAFFAAVHGGTKTTLFAGQACTSFTCTGDSCADGHVIAGQTKDTTAPLTRYRIMELDRADGRGAVLLNYPGWAVNIGLTSGGMVFTANSLYAGPPAQEAAPTSLLRRLVLERDSVDEVLACIEGLSFDNGCTLIADRTGRAVCVEAAAGEVDVLDVSGKAFAHANNIVSDRLKGLEDSAPGSPSSPVRATNLQRLLDERAGDITADDARRFLADHTDFPLSVCRHKSDRDPLWTTAAFVADLTSGAIHIAIGHPCTAPFLTYSV